MEMLCSGSVSDIRSLIMAYQFPPDALFLGEIQPQHVISKNDERQNLLRFAHFDIHIKFADYTTGRIFHSNFELRWQQASVKAGIFQVVYLGAERSTPGLQCDRYLLECKEHAENDHKNETNKYECFRLNKNHYYLFGTRLDGTAARKADERDGVVVFAEARIPRPLYYPDLSSPAERIQLEVREYCNWENSQVMWFRFAGLKAVEEQA